MIQRYTVGLFTIAVLLLAGGANAAEVVNSPMRACANIQWSEAFLKYFPKAAAACRDVAQRDGVDYARFEGRVSKVGPRLVQVDIFDVASIPITTVAFKIGVGGTVEIDDQVVQVRNLKVDDRLTIWLRNGQFGTVSIPTAQRNAIFRPEAEFSP